MITLGFESSQITQEGYTTRITAGGSNDLIYAGLELANYNNLDKDLRRLLIISDKSGIKYRGSRLNTPPDGVFSV